ncbi:hypothetical protein EJ03DRAFT_350024 [Teratosphaeria nubilosa]|uniref:Uncharacterized protein n=1 Tax=Teratosphaeria nubilosa TaxID=161662 RepID=A0A6G1LDJ1_9PEZI|nr:hypothetical protein EJ03DRAFT_350024 [Teratosphaeria nubilosa]
MPTVKSRARSAGQRGKVGAGSWRRSRKRNDEDVMILDNANAHVTLEKISEELTEVSVNEAELGSPLLLGQVTAAQEDKEKNRPVEDIQYDHTKQILRMISLPKHQHATVGGSDF